MHTADLFDLPPIARNSDPVTSKVAAAKYGETGRANDRKVVKCLVQQYPGHTVGELSEKFILHLVQRGVPATKAALKGARTTSKRLSDLETSGHIRAGLARKCRVTNHTARTWYP